MDRRNFIGALATVLGIASFAADAQPTVHRIGFLSSGSSPPYSPAPVIETFRLGLRELGWVEGQNIVIDYRFADGRFDRLPRLAAELVQLKANIIVAVPTPAVVAAKNASATIPIVMINVSDPVGQGLIASLARPGGNITGAAYSVGSELWGKELELLRETVPEVRRVAILSNPANPSHALATRDVKIAARSLGVEIQLLEARGPEEFDAAFAAMVKERVGALFIVGDTMFDVHRARLADLAAMNKLPSMHGTRVMVEAGGLMFYAPNLSDQMRRAASYVDKILRGAKPADLPVQQPTKFELVINLKTAKALGLTIPQPVLLRADEVIQ